VNFEGRKISARRKYGIQLQRVASALQAEERKTRPGGLLLPPVPFHATKNASQYAGASAKLCRLTVRDLPFGLQVSFEIPAGMSPRSLLRGIHKANSNEERGIVDPKSKFSKDPEWKIVESTAAQKVVFVLFNRVRVFDREGQAVYMETLGYELAPRWIVALGAALYRDQKGFPLSDQDICGRNDLGNLFKDKMIRVSFEALLMSGRGLYEVKDLPKISQLHFIPAGVLIKQENAQ
jgi:hypothetical protein